MIREALRFYMKLDVKTTVLKLLEMSTHHLGKDGLKWCTENVIPSMFKLAV